ncbi:MAG TPA: hypothetical protein VFW65_35530 [Pseudonocardiaceae bacterium]|nr:hypothetical protein [Pseudonocardiaceae bacterium]
MKRVHLDVGHGILATVVAPSQPAEVVVLCYPGGGYGRGYFDLHPAGHDGYSQAEHHAGRGMAVVALDHARGCGIAEVAARNAHAAGEVLRQLSADVPVVGVGHSMGAAVLTVQQAEHHCFDAIALLGWSAIRTALPPAEGISARSRAHFRWAYHWDDEPDWLVDADIGPDYPERGPECPPWGSATRPVPVADVLRPRFVASWAERVDVPVFLGFGERDVAADPLAEPTVYAASPRVEVGRFERVAHLHNFGPGRERVWDRLVRFYDDVERVCPTH